MPLPCWEGNASEELSSLRNPFFLKSTTVEARIVVDAPKSQALIVVDQKTVECDKGGNVERATPWPSPREPEVFTSEAEWTEKMVNRVQPVGAIFGGLLVARTFLQTWAATPLDKDPSCVSMEVLCAAGQTV